MNSSEHFEFPSTPIDQILSPTFLNQGHDFTLYEPPFLANRFSAQSSVFMLLSLHRNIHISKEQNSTILVDGPSKHKIRDELAVLGFKDYSMFPSLDTLAAEINNSDKSFFEPPLN